jgi:hypothetical protein
MAVDKDDTFSGQELTISPPDGDAHRVDYLGETNYSGERYLSSVKGNPRLPNGDAFQFESRKSLEQLENDMVKGYRTVDEYEAAGTPLQITSEAAINKTGNNGLIRLQLDNNSNNSVELNTPRSYIGQEVSTVFLRLIESKRTGNYRFYVSEGTERRFDDVGKWDTYDVNGDIPYVMVFVDEFAFAVGQYQGTTDVRMAMTESDPPSAIRMFVNSVVLEPGESASWKMGFAGFSHSGEPQSDARQLLNEMSGEELPPQTDNEPSGDGSGSNDTSDDGSESNDTSDDGGGSSDSSDGSGPGFSIGGALAAMGGGGYLLKRRFDDEDSE